jgi:threonine dehydratase
MLKERPEDRIVRVVSGGNIDLDKFSELLGD